MIKYNYANGEITEIEVDLKFAEIIAEMDKCEQNNNRRETRRHVSYSSYNDKVDTLIDNSFDINDEIEKKETYAKLHSAIKNLQPHQEQLVNQLLSEEKSITSIAKDLGITKQACNNRMNKIYAQLKKYL